jgi:hypothetical protein
VHFMMRKKTLLLGFVLLSAEGPSSKDGVYSFVAVEIKMHVVIRVM